MEFGVFWTGCFHWQRWIIALVYFHKACCCSTDEENIPTRDLSQWRGALAEHEQLLKRWEKAWVGLSVLFSPVSRLDCVCVTCVGFNLLCMFGFRLFSSRVLEKCKVQVFIAAITRNEGCEEGASSNEMRVWFKGFVNGDVEALKCTCLNTPIINLDYSFKCL